MDIIDNAEKIRMIIPTIIIIPEPSKIDVPLLIEYLVLLLKLSINVKGYCHARKAAS